ncbi:cilia- and flagella-associated protein 43 [Anopheles ziemanni]|uniref:cilia- and flagella-associated protein 43 n=1 Tax=Anopheles coustani TaxID=139045 RepID=UPI00265A7E99|nr:cilia- and flagella-associated protein 43 [Anopheles coustani]XP_058169703.1 cilia- and flagella-associated protein 43 [Anopheles ziemanni]
MDNNIRTKVQWMVPGTVEMACVVGNVAVAFGLGGHILFVNLKTSQKSYYIADSAQTGNGVACLTGHKLFPVLAFAERCVNPRLVLISYPANAVLSILEGDQTERSYIALCFSESELLVALTGVPDYTLEVYAWRSKELLCKKATGIFSDQQRLVCSPSTTFAVCQYAPRKSELKLWEVHGNIRIGRLIERTVQLAMEKDELPLCITFLIDGNLAIINQKAKITIVSPSSGLIGQTIDTCNVVPSSTDYIPFIFYCKGGLFASASDGQVNFYKKQKGTWNQVWSTQPDAPYSQLLHFSSSEGLLGVTVDGAIMRTSLDGDVRNVEFRIVKDLDVGYGFCCTCSTLPGQTVAIKPTGSVRVLSLETGATGCSISVGNLQCIAHHPQMPCMVVGSESGVLQLIVADRQGQAKLASQLYLSRHPLVSVTFAVVDCSYFAAVDQTGNVAIVEVSVDCQLHVLQVFDGLRQAANVFFWCSNEEALLVQPMEDLHSIRFEEIEFTVKQHHSEETKRTRLLLPKRYTQIVPKCCQTAFLFYAHRAQCNVIDLLEIYRSEGALTVLTLKSVVTPQSAQHLELCVDERFLYVWSMDGKIALYDESGASVNAICTMNFNGRFNGGIRQVSLDHKNEFLSILCHNGLLIVSKLMQAFPHSITKSSQRESKMLDYLSKSDASIEEDEREPPTGSSPTMVPWIEKREMERRAVKGKVYEPEHAAIFEEFAEIKRQISRLLDRNEKAPLEERFPLQVFNLNAEATEKLTQKANESKNNERKRLQQFIGSQGEINEKLIENCWMTMSKKPWKIRAMFKRAFVENYAMLPDSQYKQYLNKVCVYRETELNASHDALLPWKPTPTYQLESILNRDPDYGNVLDNLARASIKKSYSLSGTTTHRFFQPYSLRFDQLEVVTFEQLCFERICGDMEIEKLRNLFNNKFEEIKTLKQEEMDLVLKRNRRVRYVQDELVLLAKMMADRSTFEVEHIDDPVFEADERPETIIHTEDSEIPVAPFVSPSVERLMELDRLERERRLQEFLADDFKDRALVTMMDGVLEHRWEDEIKKSLPLPQCLEIGKEPQHYNETDIREVQEYEEQSKTLYQERMRYRKMLQAELQELAVSLDQQIKRFNTSVAKLTLEKIIIESAIRQEEMRILRAMLYNHARLIYDASGNRLREQIDQTAKYIDQLTDVMNEFQEKVADYRNTYETLRGKDRLLDKQFKINFSDTAQSALVDQAYKIFKRRPKTQLRSIVTVSVFQDLAKRIVAKKTAGTHGNLLLPKECLDYLTHCETLDQQSNCPAGMDGSLWQTLIKMRRIKIESEFRLKSCELMLSDAEAAIGAFQREITSKRNILTSIEQNLEQLRHEKFEDATNRTVQLVMKRGWIEIQQTGRESDFERCVLIHRSDVEDINAIIRRAGSKKLNAMVNAAMFRRKIIYQEWEHRALKLQLRDLRDQLATVEKCKITKEVQSWLKMKGMRRTEDLSQVALEKKIRNAIQNEEEMLQELKKSLEDIEQRINTKRRENKALDQQTRALNIDVTEQHLQRDTELEQTEQKATQDRMAAIVERARLVRLVQAQHTQILELGTMLELQRLKTYPTLTASTSVMTHNAHHLLSN